MHQELDPPADSPAPQAATHLDGVDSFYARSKWLVEWHNKRSDAFLSRSVALLGFVGVALALLASGATLRGQAYHDHAIQVPAIIAAGLLLATAGLLVFTLSAKPSGVPSVGAIRTEWHEFRFRPVFGAPQSQAVEDLLNGARLTEMSTLDWAKSEADSRGTSFTWACRAMFAALGVMSSQVVQSGDGCLLSDC